MKNKGFTTWVQLHITSSVQFSLPFCWCRQIPGFRWERQLSGTRAGVTFDEINARIKPTADVSVSYVLYCLLLPSSHSSAARKLKKKVLTNSSWGSRVSIFTIDLRRMCSLQQHHTPSWTVSPTLCPSSSTRQGTFRAGDPRAEDQPGQVHRCRLLCL